MKFTFPFMSVIMLFCFHSLLNQNVLNAQSVVINEIMSKNESTIEDKDGDFSDWIELYNLTNSPINLQGYGLSDDEDDYFKWVIPDVTIFPNSFALIFASGKDYTFGQLHTNFSLKAGGEDIFLTAPDGQLSDSVDAIELAADQSYGRSDDGGSDWIYYSTASPGNFNDTGIEFVQSNSNVVLNEIQSYNINGIQDEDGEYNDWIELYNPSSATINLNGYSLTDDEDEPDKWIFPNINIGAGDFLLVFASDKDLTSGELHTNFGIKSSGEDIFLYDADGDLVDFVGEQQLSIDQTYARVTDGSGEWEEFSHGSPGESNENGNIKLKLDFSHTQGQYANAFDLDIYLEEGQDEAGTSIYYTIDGSEPTLSANIYNQSLNIASREGDENYYSSSQFPTTVEPYDPSGEVFKINVVRARIFKDGKPSSKIYTKSYMIHPDFDRFTLPMVSIVSDPDNLFDEDKGIYVLGTNHYPELESSANFFQTGRDWERAAHFEFFFEDEEIAQDGGLRIHGGGSRRNAQKSFRLYARSEYDSDNTFDYPFFPDKPIDEFKRLVLRGQASSNLSHFSDEVVSNMCRDINITRMATRPVVVFLNGEYWGVYHLRERIDKYFLESNFDVDKDDVTLLEGRNPNAIDCCIEGDSDEYEALLDYMRENDMADDEVYNYVAQKVDVEQFATYLVTEFWVGNYDWPGNNIRYWKGPNENDKWRWIMYDLDYGFRFYDRPSILNYLGNLTTNTGLVETEFGNQLFKNDEFVNTFIELFEYHLKNTFSPEVVACEVITYANMMAPQMEDYLNRFTETLPVSYWEDRVVDMYKEFGALRPCYIQDQIFEQFGVMIDIDECSDFTPDDTPCVYESQNTNCNDLSVNFTGLPVSMPIENSVNLTGVPSGGTFSGPGVMFNSFNSGVLQPGMHTINYTYDFENGCSVTKSQSTFLYSIYFSFVNYNLGTVAPKVIDNINIEGEVFEDDVYTFEIFDLSGKQVGQLQRHFSKGTFNEKIGLDATLPRGVFFINVATSKHSYSKKFIR